MRVVCSKIARGLLNTITSRKTEVLSAKDKLREIGKNTPLKSKYLRPDQTRRTASDLIAESEEAGLRSGAHDQPSPDPHDPIGQMGGSLTKVPSEAKTPVALAATESQAPIPQSGRITGDRAVEAQNFGLPSAAGGATQIRWLEDELRNSPSSLRIESFESEVFAERDGPEKNAKVELDFSREEIWVPCFREVGLILRSGFQGSTRLWTEDERGGFQEAVIRFVQREFGVRDLEMAHVSPIHSVRQAALDLLNALVMRGDQVVTIYSAPEWWRQAVDARGASWVEWHPECGFSLEKFLEAISENSAVRTKLMWVGMPLPVVNGEGGGMSAALVEETCVCWASQQRVICLQDARHSMLNPTAGIWSYPQARDFSVVWFGVGAAVGVADWGCEVAVASPTLVKVLSRHLQQNPAPLRGSAMAAGSFALRHLRFAECVRPRLKRQVEVLKEVLAAKGWRPVTSPDFSWVFTPVPSWVQRGQDRIQLADGQAAVDWLAGHLRVRVGSWRTPKVEMFAWNACAPGVPWEDPAQAARELENRLDSWVVGFDGVAPV